MNRLTPLERLLHKPPRSRRSARIRQRRASGRPRYNTAMTREDWFDVGVRLLGIWLLIECLGELVAAAQIHFGFLRPYQSTIPAYFLHAAVELAAGLYLLLGARSLVALVYKNNQPDA